MHTMCRLTFALDIFFIFNVSVINWKKFVVLILGCYFTQQCFRLIFRDILYSNAE